MGDTRSCAMKERPRFLVNETTLAGGVATIAGSELHHMRDVMRLTPGDEVELLERSGVEMIGRIRRFERDRAVIDISENCPSRPRISIVLAAGLIKGPRMDFMVEKAVELGAMELWPMVAAHSQVRVIGRARLERWRRLATAAAKQSLAPALMEIAPPREFSEIVRAAPPDALKLICIPGAPPLRSALGGYKLARILLVCGPEGGFDRSEIETAEREEFIAAGLGPNRLRSETAALAALSIVSAALDELRGGS